jgi:thiosulfate reductase cytochrome b subunit
MARAIVLTTPLIVNVGLTLTIPATLFIDVVFNGVDRLFMYFIGVLCLIVGFFVVNIQAARDLKQKKEFLTYAAGIMSTKRLISISDYKIISGNFDEQPADVP